MGNWAIDITTSLCTALDSIDAQIVAAGAFDGASRNEAVVPSQHIGDRFEIGSITKTMTALVLAQLVLEDRTALEATVGEWLDAGANADITLGQLATHTSGLPRMAPNAWNHAGYEKSNPYAHYDGPLAEAGLREAQRDGEGIYAYSNFGYQLLGLCLERVAGTPLSEQFESRVFGPLGMATATTSATDPVLRGEVDGEAVPNWTPLLHGPGGVNATIGDMVSYLAAIAQPPDGLIGDAIRLTLEPRTQGPGGEVGLAWGLHPSGLATHGGGTAGFSTYLAADPNKHRGAIVMVNRSAPEAVQTFALTAAQGGDPVATIPRPVDDDPDRWAEPALAFFDCFVRRDFDGARTMMAPSAAEALTVARLEPPWSALSGACGELETPHATNVARVQRRVQVTIVASGQNRSLTMQTWQDDDHKFLGVTIQ